MSIDSLPGIISILSFYIMTQAYLKKEKEKKEIEHRFVFFRAAERFLYLRYI